MLGRILAETRVPPLELVETLNLEEIDVKPRPCLTLRTPRQNWGIGVRQADRRAGVRLRRRRDPGRADHAAGGLDRAGPGDPPRPADRELGRRQAVRAGLPRGEGPAARPRHARAAGQAAGAGDQGPGGRRLAGRGRGQADPPGRRVQAGALHRHRLVRAGRRRRLRGPERQPARPAGRRQARRPDGRAGRRLDGDAPRGVAQEVRHARRPGLRQRERQPAVQPVAGRRPRRAAGRAARDPGRRRLREGPAEPPRSSRGSWPLDSPPGFHGELRPYQREGLGWLDYLQRFGFGGILADDMGLGKTIQVLALLQRRRAHRQAKGPSLAVVPRSLVFNWIAGGREVHARAAGARLHRARPPPAPRAVPRLRPDRHHLRHAAQRHRRAGAPSSSTTRSSTRRRRSRTPRASRPRRPGC